MSIFNHLNNRILKLFSISILVLALVISPSLLEKKIHFFSSSPALEFNDLATASEPKSTKQDIQFNVAQAPVLSQGEEKAPQQAKAQEETIDFFGMAMGALAGLVLFIYGVTRLSEGLEDVSTDRMKSLLSKFTTNRFAGVLTGAVATTLLESSSVTIIMVIAMVSAGVLTFVQSLGVVLGSNIGTAVGAQIIALDIKRYVPILMFSGLALLFLGKKETLKNLGIILLGFGLMFYGLEAIDEAMKPFRDYQPFLNLMETLGNNPLLGALVGAIFTVIIQSSSATVAIVVTLASSGLISLAAGIAIMLGAEVGTCADTLVATIGRGRPALRTGVFHLLFNLVSAMLGIIFAPVLVKIVQAVSGGAGIGRQVANAQILFNLVGVAVVILFLPVIARLLERLIPDAPQKQELGRETITSTAS
ncbi:MAG: Na/Pi symporter [Scytonematopsis contorta HA4267-MV1]|jgi:phosphate:Na+ symporter|nr:Na/Pi symporter [Scytonematopsis contorta HA4267-MV1]